MALFIEGDDAPRNATTPYIIEPGDMFRGILDTSRGADWIAAELDAGRTYTVTLDGVIEDDVVGLGDPVLSVLDASSTFVTGNDDAFGTLNSFLQFSPVVSGIYYFQAESYQSTPGGEYTLTLNTDPIEETDAPADTSTDASLTLGNTFSGSVDAMGDADWIAVDLDEGFTYRLDLVGFGSEFLFDPEVALYDDAGNLVASDDDGGFGLDAAMVRTIETSGTYYIGVGSAAADPDGTGDYRLSLIGTPTLDGPFNGSGGDDYVVANPDQFLNFNGFGGDDLIIASNFAAAIQGGGGDDSLVGGDGSDTLLGNGGDDDIRGNGGADLLRGNGGNDVIVGGGGIDALRGGGGDDDLAGGLGDDLLISGGGSDTMTGGVGADTFVIRGTKGDNVITDFELGTDALIIANSTIGRQELSAQDIVDRFATVDGGDTIFAFKNGVTVTLDGVTDLAALADSVL